MLYCFSHSLVIERVMIESSRSSAKRKRKWAAQEEKNARARALEERRKRAPPPKKDRQREQESESERGRERERAREGGATSFNEACDTLESQERTVGGVERGREGMSENED